MTGNREVIGLDIGGARTKAVRARDDVTWEGSSPPAGHVTFLRALLGAMGQLPVPVDRTVAAVAAPDRWRIGRHADHGPLATTAAGEEWVRALRDDVGLAEVRLVPGLQCVVATEVHADPAPGCVVACDVGATTVDAAVYAWDGHATRLLDAEHAEVGADDPDALLFEEMTGPDGGPGATAIDPAARMRRIADDRSANGRRIALVLRRAKEQERYRDTPVCVPGGGPAVVARVLDAALRPVAATAAVVVRRLAGRVADTPRPELVLTGGNALGPVVDAVLAAAAGLVQAVRVVPPATAAKGAALIGLGVIGAADGYPHQLGVEARRIRDGLLESLVLPLDVGGSLVVEVPGGHEGPLPVAVRVGRLDPWRRTIPAEDVPVPPGRHRVRFMAHRGGLGAVVLTHEDTGAEVTQLLAAPAGAVAVDGSRHER